MIPTSSRFDKLRQAIVRKNELYVHSWRPQNITFLFLFWKQEQGNDAKEVEEFRPLVEARSRNRCNEEKQSVGQSRTRSGKMKTQGGWRAHLQLLERQNPQ